MRITQNYYEIKPRSKQQQVVKRRNKVDLTEIKLPCYLFLDQASNTGFSLFDSESRLVITGTINRGRTSLPDFKKELVEYIRQLTETYQVETLFHEEVYDQLNMVTTEVLFYIKHAIQDLGYFNKNLTVLGLDHRTWKSNLAKPEKFNFSADNKKETEKWVHDIYPLINLKTEDEYDALGMGISVMIKEKGKKNFYKQARYNKKLPVHFMLHEDTFPMTEDVEVENLAYANELLEAQEEETTKQIESIVQKLRKPFREAYKADGVAELELEKRKGVEDTFRRYLSHKDKLVYVRIPKDYKYWGVLLLEHGISPETFETKDNPDGSYCLIGCRKKRL